MLGGGVSHPLQLTTGLLIKIYNNQSHLWQVSICYLFFGKY